MTCQSKSGTGGGGERGKLPSSARAFEALYKRTRYDNIDFPNEQQGVRRFRTVFRMIRSFLLALALNN